MGLLNSNQPKTTIARLGEANGRATRVTQTKKKGPFGLWTTDKTLTVEYGGSGETRPADYPAIPAASLTTAQTTTTQTTLAQTPAGQSTATQTTMVQTATTAQQQGSAGLSVRQIAETVVISGAVVLTLLGAKQMLPSNKNNGK